MPTTSKQKKARKSRGLEMLSDIENLDIILGENHFNPRERDESLNSNLARRPESVISNDIQNEGENTHLNRGIANLGLNTDFDQHSATANSSALEVSLHVIVFLTIIKNNLTTMLICPYTKLKDKTKSYQASVNRKKLTENKSKRIKFSKGFKF